MGYRGVRRRAVSVSFHGWELHSFKEQAKKAPADLRADPSGACKNLAFELRNNPLYLEAMGAFFERGIVRSALHVVGEQARSEEHTSELQSQSNLVCRLLLEKNHILPRALSSNIQIVDINGTNRLYVTV